MYRGDEGSRDVCRLTRDVLYIYYGTLDLKMLIAILKINYLKNSIVDLPCANGEK